MPAWDHLRALLVTAHLLAIGALAIPAPVGGMNERAFQDPNVQASFAAWARPFAALGLPVTPATVESIAWVGGRLLVDGRAALVAPLRPYVTFAGVGQHWSMFGQVNARPARFEVWLDEGDALTLLYAPHDPEARWMAPVLEHERIRTLFGHFDWRTHRRAYAGLAAWLGPRAAAAFPTAEGLVVQMVEAPIPAPAALRASGALPEGKAYWVTRVPFRGAR
jgi:hypothetical protein